MKNRKKNKQKRIRDTKYFKWGFTAFFVIIASICFIFAIYNADKISAGIRTIFKVLTPIIDGFVIAYLLNPIVRFFEVNVLEKSYIKNNIAITSGRKKRFRVFSIILTFVIVAVFLYAFFGTVLPQLYSSIESIIIHFPTYYNNVVRSIDVFISNSDIVKANDVQELINTYSVDINRFINENILPNAKDVLKSLSSGVVNIVGALFNLIIGFIVAIYLLNSKEKYVGLVKKVIYSLLPRESANNILVDIRFINKTFGGFLVGKIVDSIIIGFLCFAGLNILHTPYAVLVSVIVGITNIIPFFGPYLGAIPSAFLILIVDPRQCLYFLIFVIILQQIDGNIIGPAILGNSIGISSFWIILAITVFGGFFGIPGMIVGVPIFACFYAFIRRRVNNRLKNKNLPIATVTYAEAKYIDDKNNFVLIDHHKTAKQNQQDKSSPQYARYIELNPSEAYADSSKNEIWYIKLINKIIMSLVAFVKNTTNKQINSKSKTNNIKVNEEKNISEAALNNTDNFDDFIEEPTEESAADKFTDSEI